MKEKALDIKVSSLPAELLCKESGCNLPVCHTVNKEVTKRVRTLEHDFADEKIKLRSMYEVVREDFCFYHFYKKGERL